MKLIMVESQTTGRLLQNKSWFQIIQLYLSGHRTVKLGINNFYKDFSHLHNTSCTTNDDKHQVNIF